MGNERQIPSGFQNGYGLVTTVHFPFFHISNGNVYCYFVRHIVVFWVCETQVTSVTDLWIKKICTYGKTFLSGFHLDDILDFKTEPAPHSVVEMRPTDALVISIFCIWEGCE